uniref:Uncharacterized protein n=1 Tax=Thermosporothrix sp. COM3 TaxID=2490863 RepID=A0A455STZ0_9CHLR|nr:hypothetical protein KTC_57090 [Thermosporothrix sp. COM3]
MKRKLFFGIVAALLAVTLMTFASRPASAHGGREVGKYYFTVGFLDEPAYAGLKNGLDLTICDGECKYTMKEGSRVISNPVEGLEKSLKAEVSMGGSAPLALTLEPRYMNPGKYAAYFIPSKAGAYTFHIFGAINGQKVDEKFTSGIDHFSEVEEIAHYPQTTAGQPQQSASTDVDALRTQVNDATNRANTATTIGIIGIVAGVVGLAAAGLALARKSSKGGAPAQKETIDSLRG